MNQLDSRITIDSGGRLMPLASEDALAVPWTIFELVVFWFARAVGPGPQLAGQRGAGTEGHRLGRAGVGVEEGDGLPPAGQAGLDRPARPPGRRCPSWRVARRPGQHRGQQVAVVRRLRRGRRGRGEHPVVRVGAGGAGVVVIVHVPPVHALRPGGQPGQDVPGGEQCPGGRARDRRRVVRHARLTDHHLGSRGIGGEPGADLRGIARGPPSGPAGPAGRSGCRRRWPRRTRTGRSGHRRS